MIDVLAASRAEGLVLGLLALPVCLWAAYTDLSAMRIRNEAVLALLAVFALAGPVVLPFDAYLWRYVQVILVLVLGFGLATAGALGAGDAKFAAAMAAFVSPADAGVFVLILASALAVTLAGHRAARAVPAIRDLAPGWRSWRETKDFPLGIALAAALVTYLGLAALA